jgi:serine/threonine protein kinase
MTTLPPGTRIGPYDILGKIATGGMGAVYRAQHRTIQREAALKVLLPGLAEDTEFIQRLHREARAVAALRHPHIVEIYDANVEVQPYFLAMEYLPGGSIQGQLVRLKQQHQRMGVSDALAITRQIASALDYAHTKGFIHRDIKPSNVLIADDGRYVLTDFGIAASQQSTKLTKTSVSMGTPDYMSPEQAQGMSLDKRSDIYSLGVMLYEMLAGTVPFSADTPLAVALKHVREAPRSVKQLRSEVSPAVKAVVDKAMAKKPADRFQTAAEMIAALDQAAMGKAPRRSVAPVLFAGLGVVGLSALAAIVISLLGNSQQETSVASVATSEASAATQKNTVEASATVVEPTVTFVPTAVEPTPTPRPSATPSPEPTASPTTVPTALPSATVIATATSQPKESSTQSAPEAAPPPPTSDTASAAVQASGSPKGGQLFNFERLPSCRRGDEPYATLALTNDTEFVHDGRGAMKWSYNFPAVANNYVVFRCAASMPGDTTGLSTWVYGDGSRHFLNVWIKDAAGETRQYTFGRISHTGWRQMYAAFDDRRGWPNAHISGPDNGKLDYPVSFDSWVLDGAPDGSASEGEIYLDEAYAARQPLPETAADATPAPRNQIGNTGTITDTAAASYQPVETVARGDRLQIVVKENRGSYRRWGKQVAPNSCSTDDSLGATLKFDVVLILTNTGDRDLNDLRAVFQSTDSTTLVACGNLPIVPIGASATVPIHTFAEIPVSQVLISNSRSEVIGRACFARPAPGTSDVVALPCP